MNEPKELIKSNLQQLFKSQYFMTLATLSGERLHTSLIAFAAGDDLREIFFITPRATRKFANLTAHADVSALIDNRSNDPADAQKAVGVTVYGKAKPIEPKRREQVLDLFCAKHPGLSPFAYSPDSELITIVVSGYDIVSQFQNVETYIP